MVQVDVGGAHVWVEEYGTGDRVVLSSQMSFGRYPGMLAESPTHCRVVTIQARGFGRSSHLAEPPPLGWLDQWADDVVTVADQLGVRRFVYTGASHGAGIGWHLARRHRERLAGLISIVGTPHDRAGDTSSSAGRRQIVANRRDRDVIERQLRIIAGTTDTPEQAAVREETIDELVERSLRLSDEEGRINQGMPFPEATTNDELAAVLRTIEVPVLIVAGLRDGVISPESAMRAAVNVRGATAVFFQDEGHFVSRERPERFVPAIARFLDELAPTWPDQ